MDYLLHRIHVFSCLVSIFHYHLSFSLTDTHIIWDPSRLEVPFLSLSPSCCFSICLSHMLTCYRLRMIFLQMPKIVWHPQASHAAEVKGHMLLSSVLKILSAQPSVHHLLTQPPHTHLHTYSESPQIYSDSDQIQRIRGKFYFRGFSTW